MRTTQFIVCVSTAIALVTTSCNGVKKSGTPAGSNSNYALENLLPYARPMCGTAGGANTYPGATLPFGMIQWSPDTELGLRKGGYSDADTRISDFSVDHISGAGCSYGEDFAMMPISGQQPTAPPDKRNAFALPFSHTNEQAAPGYYGVTFDNGVKAELTTTMRTGFGGFTYPAHNAASMMINAAS